MMDLILLYLGSGLTVIWGVAHLFPTKLVVQGFGEISIDNRRIITMEWITEGLALIFIGVLVAAVTAIDPSNVVSTAIYFISVIMLLAMALLSLFTGFKISFLPFKLCPFIFTASAVLIMIGGLIIGGRAAVTG
jgi:hypothetical protein